MTFWSHGMHKGPFVCDLELCVSKELGFMPITVAGIKYESPVLRH
jgi:hypothetical protein